MTQPEINAYLHLYVIHTKPADKMHINGVVMAYWRDHDIAVDRKKLLDLINRYRVKLCNAITHERYARLYFELTGNTISDQLDIDDQPGSQKHLFL